MAGAAAIVGAGHTRFGTLDSGPKELMRSAVDQALRSVDRGADSASISEGFLATLGFGGWQIGNSSALLAEAAGRPDLPVTRVENACASGGFAIRAAARTAAQSSGGLTLVVGLEKMTDIPNARRRYWLGVSGDTEWERSAGLTFAGVYGLLASRYALDHPRTREAMTAVAVKNHANGALNPNAHFQKVVRAEDVDHAATVAEPLRLFDCCPVSDGAAALLIAPASEAKRWTDTPVMLSALGAASDSLAVQERPQLTEFGATRKAAAEAFSDADFDRRSVGLLEVHDCFTIAELLALEDLGFAGAEGAFALTVSGATARTGSLPVNPDGGLKAKGHPIGATGVSQGYEVFLQLRAQAGRRQVPGVERALAHNVGGAGATATVTLFARG